MGDAFPKMHGKNNALLPSIWLEPLWGGVWHLPVIDYLGTATPHADYWFRYFLAFTAAMTAIPSVDRLDLHEHGKPVVGAVHAR